MLEFKGFKIDFTALAAFVTAISSLIFMLKGSKQKTRKKKEEDDYG